MRGRLLLAHRPGRSLRLPRDRRGERPRTTASPLGAVVTILGPGWGHAIRPITAGRAIGGGDRRRAGPARSPSALPESDGSSHRQSAREHWAMLLSANTMSSRPRAQRRDESSSGSSNKNSTGRLRMPMHESEIGIRTGKLTVADRGELHTTKPPFAETRFRQAIADGLAGEQAAAGASAASTIESHEHRPLTAKTGVRVP